MRENEGEHTESKHSADKKTSVKENGDIFGIVQMLSRR